MARRATPSGLSGAMFGFQDANLLYGIKGRAVVAYNIAGGTFTTVLNLDSIVPNYSQSAGPVSVDYTDTKFAVAFGGSQDTYPYIVVWDKTTGAYTLLDLANGTVDGRPVNLSLGGVHSQMIDRSGRYVSVVTTTYSKGFVWDTQTKAVTPYSTRGSGHDVLGFGNRINQSGIESGGISDSRGFTLRSLADPNANLTQLIDPPPPSPYSWNADGHWSWGSVSPGTSTPMVGSFYRQNSTASQELWDDEIVAVRTDGATSTVWRLAHHRSIYTSSNFWTCPRGNLSRDGRYFIFTSNWENQLGKDASGKNRTDVFLLELTVNSAPAGPVISSINPSSVPAGGPDFTLSISGSGFDASSRVFWGATELPTSFVSETAVSAAVSSALVAAPGTASVTVQGASGTSNAVVFTIACTNPAISGLSPSSVQAGSPDFVLTVSGSNFGSRATVQWDGSALVTTYVSAAQLTAVVPAALVAFPRTAAVTVLSNGFLSNHAAFTIRLPDPVIAAIAPASAKAGGPAFTLTVTGSNFTLSSVVNWNGSPLPTTYVDAGTLQAAVGQPQIAAPGTSVVTVSSGSALSNTVTFTILPPDPSLASISPSEIQAGSGAFNVQVTGSNFVSGAVVYWSEAALQTTFSDSTRMTGRVTQDLVASPATANITVRQNGAVSNPLVFTVRSGPSPKITELNPSSVTAGRSSFTLTIKGSGFARGSVIRWNDTALATKFVNREKLSAVIQASYVAAAGTASITVVNPDGALSNAATFAIW